MRGLPHLALLILNVAKEWHRKSRFKPRDEYPCGLLAHTGPKTLNVVMRQKAVDKGWLLNEKHILDENCEPIDVTCEKDVFDQLDMDYLEPSERT